MKRQMEQGKKLKMGVAILLITIVITLANLGAMAQSVNITVNIIPPYSPYYSDYSGKNANKVFLILQNLTNAQLKIKLAGNLDGNNGIHISTYSNYVPLQPIVLNAHETRQLSGTALKDIFDLNALSVSGVDKGKLALTSQLPEGNYSFCIQALDYGTRRLLSATAPLGCTSIDIVYPEAPVLINPQPFAQVPVITPQMITFNWLNPGIVPLGTQYKIEMAEMPDVPADPNQILNATSLPMLSQTVTGFSYLYNIANLGLTPGKKYAWRVTSFDPSGRVLFHNKGVSAAAIFVYGQSNQSPLFATNTPSQDNPLSIITPDCSTGTGKVIIGPHSNLSLNWLWKEQIDSMTMFGLLDTNILKHYTRHRTAAGSEPIAAYKIEIVRVGNKKNNLRGSGVSSYSLQVKAPLQNVSLSEADVIKAGLAPGQSYKLVVAAVNNFGKIISKTESCTWLLENEKNSQIPKLNISGHLMYSFDKSLLHNANNANISLQIVNEPKPKILGIKSGNKTYPMVQFDPTKDIASVTTDSHGNFTAQINQAPTDTGKKYILLRINSAYYQLPADNINVTIPKLTAANNGAASGLSYTQDTLRLGDIKTQVYNYTLTVTMQKGFSGGITKQQWKDDFNLDPNSYNGSSLVDTVSIDSKSVVEAGLPVSLYRKVKAADIPFYEGDITENSTVAQGKSLKGAETPSHGSTYIKVADGVTGVITDANKQPQTVVVFNNLVCNFGIDDEYFIKATLSATDTLGSSTSDVAAPEQQFSYSPANFNWQTTHYNASVVYRLISKKPPTSHVKGKLLYQWPSAPGVLHPYANRHITVKMHATLNADDYSNVGFPTTNCQFYPEALYEVVKLPDGSTYNRSLPNYKDGTIVATGTTDANGNFDIEILALTEMGQINIVGKKLSNTPQGPTCSEKQATFQRGNSQMIKDKAKTGDAGIVTGNLEQEFENSFGDPNQKMEGNGENGSYGDGIFFGSGGGSMGFSSKNGKQGGDFGINFLTGNGSSQFSVQNANGGLTYQVANNDTYVNTLLNSLFGANLGPGPGGLNNAGDQLKNAAQDQSKGLGPNADDDQVVEDQNTGVMGRYFSLEGLPTLVKTNNSQANTPDNFVVQPFQTVDLGTLLTNVDEIKGSINVYVLNGDYSALNGAKVVVFRTVAAKAADPKFDGEGSVNHPIKPLLSPNFGSSATYTKSVAKQGSDYGMIVKEGYQQESYQYTDPVEWVIDVPLSISKGSRPDQGVIDLSNLRLASNGAYSLQITPNAENSGGSFQPLMVSLPIENSIDYSYDGYMPDEAFISNNIYGTQVIGTQNKTSQLPYQDDNGIYVSVAPSRIAGRVMDKSSSRGLKNAQVTLEIYTGTSSTTPSQTKTMSTVDTSGYFEVNQNQFPGFNWKDNDHVRITASAYGYQNSAPPPIKGTINLNSLPILTANGSKVYQEILLNPAATITGTIVNESSQVVDSYIMRDDSTLYSNNDLKKGIPVTSNTAHVIKIFPKDVGYFDTTLNVTTGVGTTALNQVMLYRRKHRMEFHIASNGIAAFQLNTLKVIINNEAAKSAWVGADGVAKIDFENISVNNYTVQVADVTNGGYVPKIFNLKNEESRQPIIYNVIIEKGATVTGIVTMDNKPVGNAKVYIDFSTGTASAYQNRDKNSDPVPLFETRSKANGSYTLTGIPVSDGNSVKIHATLDTAFTVNGAEGTIAIQNKKGTGDLVLTRFDGPNITSVWGYPLSVEKMERVDNFTVKVTGIIDLGKNNSSFTWLNPDNKIRINKVVFTGSQQYNAYKAEPKIAIVPLDGVTSIKMKFLDKYNVVLQGGQSSDDVEPLALEKDGSGGAVFARVSITDNSFNFPSSYLSFDKTGPFYLSELQPGSNGQHATMIKALYNTGSSNNATQQTRSGGNQSAIAGAKANTPLYNLSDAAGNALQFSFIGFNTVANPISSFVDVSGKFHLDATLSGKVPNSTPGDIDIHIKDLVLDGDSIRTSKGVDAITVNLQTWKLLVNNWVVDPKLGGIYSTNSVIKTGVLDIPVKTFNLRSDLFVVKDFDLSNVSLGGGLVNLTGIDNTNAHLVFDEACGSDHGKHWRFSSSAVPGGAAAHIPLPAVGGITPAKTLDVDYFQLVSFNNENIISLSGASDGMKLYNNNRFTFYPSSITSDINSFTLGGQAAFDVPRLTNTAFNLTYTKSNGNFTVTPGAFKLNFEGKGYVQYSNDQTKSITYDNNTSFISGSVVEPNKINSIPCVLSFGNNDPGTITLNQGYNINLDGPGEATPQNLTITVDNKLPNYANGMHVEAATNDWSTLKFAGLMNDPKSGTMVVQKPTYNFEVLGDVTASSSGVSMDQVNTPLGDVAMTYDFPSKTLHGSLHMNQVDFGGKKFSGDVQLTFSPHGMLLLGAGSLNTGTLLVDGFGTFNIGLLFGNTSLTQDNINTVTQYSIAGQTKCWLSDNSQNFKGFFLDGGYDIISEHDGFDIGIASVYFNATLGVEASIGANFNTKNFMALVGAHGDVDAGLSAITGTSISGGVKAHLTAEATYSKQGFGINGDAGVMVNFQVCQYIPVYGTKCLSASKGASVKFGTGGGKKTYFTFSLGKDDGTVQCSNNVNK